MDDDGDDKARGTVRTTGDLKTGDGETWTNRLGTIDCGLLTVDC